MLDVLILIFCSQVSAVLTETSLRHTRGKKTATLAERPNSYIYLMFLSSNLMCFM